MGGSQLPQGVPVSLGGVPVTLGGVPAVLTGMMESQLAGGGPVGVAGGAEHGQAGFQSPP